MCLELHINDFATIACSFGTGTWGRLTCVILWVGHWCSQILWFYILLLFLVFISFQSFIFSLVLVLKMCMLISIEFLLFEKYFTLSFDQLCDVFSHKIYDVYNRLYGANALLQGHARLSKYINQMMKRILFVCFTFGFYFYSTKACDYIILTQL